MGAQAENYVDDIEETICIKDTKKLESFTKEGLKVYQNEIQDRKTDVKCFLESLYHDLDNIILDANQNPTIPNFNLNHGLLLYKIKSLNEKLKDQNQQIQVVHILYYSII